MYTKKQRLAAILIFIYIIITLISPALFFVKESNHRCCGENCPICECIHSVEETIKSINSFSYINDVIAIFYLFFLIICPTIVYKFVDNRTLVSQKVRLNN